MIGCLNFEVVRANDFATFKRTIDTLLQKTWVFEVNFCGEAAVAHPDLSTMINYCRRNEIYATLSLTGIQVNDQQITPISIDSFAQLRRDGLNKVIFAEPTVCNQKLVYQAMCHAVQSGLLTAAQFSPTTKNCQSFPAFLQMADQCGVDEVRISKFTSSNPLAEAELNAFMTQACNFITTHTRIEFDESVMVHKKQFCTIGRQNSICAEQLNHGKIQQCEKNDYS